MIPEIVVFARHKDTCAYRGDETHMRCHCPKHLRWSHGGKQYRKSAKSRTLDGALREKHRIEESYMEGKPLAPTAGPVTIKNAAETFIQCKRDENLSADVIRKYKRELARLESWMAQHGITAPKQLSLDALIKFRATWETLYPSSRTRQKVQERLRGFLRYLRNAGHMQNIPELKAIKVDESPTLPLNRGEYENLLAAIAKAYKGDAEKAKRVRALTQLMRWSGLAIHDASTLERGEIVRDKEKNLYRIVTAREKTGVHVSVPIPDVVARELLAVLNGNPNYVFWNGSGNPESVPKYFQREFRENVKLDGFRPHRLRDTFAVDLLSKGVPIDEVSKLLGHRSVKTTEKSYAPWVKSRQDRLDELVTATWND